MVRVRSDLKASFTYHRMLITGGGFGHCVGTVTGARASLN
jgi:hypothetical protein